jgi:hypothetical protein
VHLAWLVYLLLPYKKLRSQNPMKWDLGLKNNKKTSASFPIGWSIALCLRNAY